MNYKTKNAAPKPTLYIVTALLHFTFLHISAQSDSISDIEGNFYQIVKIGDQWWTAENLKTNKYKNGDDIPNLTDAGDWKNTTEGAYCFYENNTGNAEKFGNLYNWFTASDERGICPEGWHVPSDSEWIQMEKFLGMSDSESERMTAWRGTSEGDKIKDTSFGGNNSTGFTALGTGYRDPEGLYKAMGTDNDYWTSTPYMNDGNEEGILHGLLNTRSDVVRNFHVPGYGFCIRCVKSSNTGMLEKSIDSESLLYPNPAGDRLYVNTQMKGSTVRVYNLTGKSLISWQSPDFKQCLDISSLESGLYIVRIQNGKNLVSARLIKEL